MRSPMSTMPSSALPTEEGAMFGSSVKYLGAAEDFAYETGGETLLYWFRNHYRSARENHDIKSSVDIAMRELELMPKFLNYIGAKLV